MYFNLKTGVQEKTRHDSQCHALVDKVGISEKLDSMTPEAFSKIIDSVN